MESTLNSNNPVQVINTSPLDAKGGVDLLLQVAAMMRVTHPALRWQITGDGELKQAFVHLCDWLNIEDIVIFSGDVGDSAYHHANIFVSSCRDLALLEQQIHMAQQAGLPLLMMRLPYAQAQLVQSDMLKQAEHLYMSEQAHPESLADALCQWLMQNKVTT